MKKLLFLLILTLAALNMKANVKSLEVKNYFRTDSAYVYAWNELSKDWDLNTCQLYYYGSEGRLDSVIGKAIGTNGNISKTINYYNENGVLTTYINHTWNGVWVPTSKYQISYDEENQYSEIVVQTWRNGDWVNTRLDKYTKYNLNGTQSEFQMYDWKVDKWVYHITDYSSYNEVGQLIKREAILPNNSVYYQIIYEYDINGLIFKMYAQFASGVLWNNSWLREYQYNDCSMQASIIQYKGVKSEWVLQTKTVPFTSFNSAAFPEKKVPVCHNGHTIYVSKNALPAHLSHGDCIGECTKEEKPKSRDFTPPHNNPKPPFTIYPNPAKEKIIIRFEKDECLESARVEFTDFYGKLIKVFNIKDDNELVIYRGNLTSGKYYVRLVGKQVYSAILIFE